MILKCKIPHTDKQRLLKTCTGQGKISLPTECGWWHTESPGLTVYKNSRRLIGMAEVLPYALSFAKIHT